MSGIPEEVIASQYDLQRQALASQLLEAVKASSPQFFERLVVTLWFGWGTVARFLMPAKLSA